MEESFICEPPFEVQTCNAIRLATEAEKLFELMRSSGWSNILSPFASDKKTHISLNERE